MKSIIKNILGKKNNNITQKIGKKTNEKEKVNPKDIFKDILSIEVNGNMTLKNIYITKFQEKIKDYLLFYIRNIYLDGAGVINNTIEKKYSEILCTDIFKNYETVPLEKITIRNKSNSLNIKKIKYRELELELTNYISWNIYTIGLDLLLKNLNETNKFIKDIKSNLILLLFYLFDIKKSIYKYYIERLDSLTNINMSDNNSSTNLNIIYNNSESVKKTKSKRKKENTDTNTDTYIDLNKKIDVLKKKIVVLKNKSSVKNDEKILILETKLKKLFIQKLSEE